MKVIINFLECYIKINFQNKLKVKTSNITNYIHKTVIYHTLKKKLNKIIGTLGRAQDLKLNNLYKSIF